MYYGVDVWTQTVYKCIYKCNEITFLNKKIYWTNWRGWGDHLYLKYESHCLNKWFIDKFFKEFNQLVNNGWFVHWILDLGDLKNGELGTKHHCVDRKSKHSAVTLFINHLFINYIPLDKVYNREDLKRWTNKCPARGWAGRRYGIFKTRLSDQKTDRWPPYLAFFWVLGIMSKYAI